MSASFFRVVDASAVKITRSGPSSSLSSAFCNPATLDPKLEEQAVGVVMVLVGKGSGVKLPPYLASTWVQPPIKSTLSVNCPYMGIQGPVGRSDCSNIRMWPLPVADTVLIEVNASRPPISARLCSSKALASAGKARAMAKRVATMTSKHYGDHAREC